jgi:hypothetical protein
MLIKFGTSLKDLAGEPIFPPDSKVPMTLESVSVASLVTLMQEDQSVDAKTKYDWGHLANQIYGQKEFDVSTEQVVLLKNRIGKLYGPLIVVQTWDMLEGRG